MVCAQLYRQTGTSHNVPFRPVRFYHGETPVPPSLLPQHCHFASLFNPSTCCLSRKDAIFGLKSRNSSSLRALGQNASMFGHM